MEALLGVGADDNGMMWHEEAVMTYFQKETAHSNIQDGQRRH